jgi:hypothetical protein
LNAQQHVQAALKRGYVSMSRELLMKKGRRVLTLYGGFIADAVKGTSIPAALVAVRIGHETDGNPRAVSRNKERGLMQWGPWHNYGSAYGVGPEKAFDPETAIKGGVRMWAAQDRELRAWCKRKLGVEPVGWDRWALLWAALSNGRGGVQAFLEAMDPDQAPVLQHAVHEMVSPSGAASMYRLAEAGRFGLKAYWPNWMQVVESVTRRTGRALMATEAAAALGGDMSYGVSFIVGGALAAFVLLAVVYGPQILGG